MKKFMKISFVVSTLLMAVGCGQSPEERRDQAAGFYRSTGEAMRGVQAYWFVITPQGSLYAVRHNANGVAPTVHFLVDISKLSYTADGNTFTSGRFTGEKVKNESDPDLTPELQVLAKVNNRAIELSKKLRGEGIRVELVVTGMYPRFNENLVACLDAMVADPAPIISYMKGKKLKVLTIDDSSKYYLDPQSDRLVLATDISMDAQALQQTFRSGGTGQEHNEPLNPERRYQDHYQN